VRGEFISFENVVKVVDSQVQFTLPTDFVGRGYRLNYFRSKAIFVESVHKVGTLERGIRCIGATKKKR
jgi:hypothetical protein